MKGVLIGVILVLAVLGTLVFVANQRGWKRNGYFTIPATILIVLGIFIGFQALGAMLTLIMNGGKLEGAEGLGALAMNGVAQLIVMLAGALLVSLAARQNPFAVFRLQGIRETPISAYFLAIPLILLAQAVGIAISSLWIRLFEFFPGFYSMVDKYETAGDTQLQAMVTAHGPLQFVVILLLVAIVPALAEETLFRGFAQSNIERSGHGHARPMVALVVASLLFAAIHGSLFKLPGLLALGLALGWMAYRTNNLFVGSVGHAINNGVIVFELFLNPGTSSASANSVVVGNTDLSGTQSLLLLGFTAPILCLLLYLFARATVHTVSRYNSELEIESLHGPLPFIHDNHDASI
jgi:membrane protease YdiL (CAAX protease family)